MQKCGKYSQKSVIPGRRKITPFSLALLLCFCLALGETSQAGAETPVCGYILANTTWEKAKSPYIVTCSVIVDSGITLTIEPGVEVRFDGNCSLTIDGTLIARGTGLDPIVFTANTQYWAYIHFRDGSTDAAYDVDGNYVSGSILQYCMVEYAGASAVSNNGALRLEKAHPYIDHCTLKNNMVPGVYAWDLTGTLKITNSTINHNKASASGGGIYLDQNGYPTPNSFGVSEISNNTISFNETSGSGGGVYLNNLNTSAFVAFKKNILFNNKAGRDGGGLFSTSITNTVSDNIFLQNTATNSGGGMVGRAQTTKNIFSDNLAKYGGAYYTYFSGSGPNYLQSNSFLRNTSLNETWSLGYATTFENNLVAYNQTTGATPTWTILVNYRLSRLNKNNFFSNTVTYELKNNIASDTDATENWWGTAVQGEIEDKIYDRQDDPTKGVVDFAPWATAMRTDVPISPPQNLTVTQTRRGPSLTWKANPEGNVAGYKIYWGKTNGYPYSNVRDVKKVTHYTFEPSDLPSGTYYFAVTAYNTNYPMIEDDPATLINEKQTAGYESWFSSEQVGSRLHLALPFLPLLLLDD